MNDNTLKFNGAVLLYALWALLVWRLKLDPSELVGSIKYALGALGLYHAVTNLQIGQPTALQQLLDNHQQLLDNPPPPPSAPTVPGAPTMTLGKGPQ
jgi:hypothetical protein